MTGYAIYDTELGQFYFEYKDDIITAIKKADGINENEAKKTSITEKAFLEILEYLKGERKQFTFKYEARGTEFQKKVWSALCDIPYGQTRSYKDIAKAIGNEKASRAVGMANNKNPIIIAVPCHRVIGANGKLVGYAGGMQMKEYLLKMESDNK